MIKATTLLVLIASIACYVNAFSGMQTAFSRSSTELQMTKLTYNGKAIEFKEGSPLKNACARLGMKPRYSCKK